MRRILSMLLAVVMVMGLIPFAAFATEGEALTETEPVSVTEPAAETVPAPETEPVHETEPVRETETVPETEPVVELETIPETEPMTETEPVQETEPARKVESFEIPFTVNPIYEGIYTASDFPRIERPEASTGEADGHDDLDFWQDQELLYAPSYQTIEQAAVTLRGYMLERSESFTLYFKSDNAGSEVALQQMLEIATEHNGKSKQGDYLLWHFGGWGGQISREYLYGEYRFTFEAEMYYLTTHEQERELDTVVTNLLNTLNLRRANEYQKVKAVYDYICQNITYDYANLEDDTYLLKHSAYAALVNKTAVCQGYATLFYRLMLELGIDCRVIPGLDEEGYAHAWNIVKIGDVYYNLDATWDAGYDEYYWFLRNTINFIYHYRYMEYATTQFHTDYPMAQEDYVDGVPGVPEKYFVIGLCGDEVAFAIDRDRNLTIAGNGPMWDFGHANSVSYVDASPWYAWKDAFEHVIIEDGVTSIGDNAFYQMKNITSVVLPNTLVAIGYTAFEYCTALEAITLPDSLEVIEEGAFNNCSEISEIKIPDKVTRIERVAFFQCYGLQSVTIGAGITYIGSQAFSRTKLTELVIPDNVTMLDSTAFAYCGSLRSVKMGKGLKTLEESVFRSCVVLSEVEFSDNLETIGNWAFQNTALTEVVIPDVVTQIGSMAFAECGNLQYAKVGSSVESLDGTFYECSSLTKVELPMGLISIGMEAFEKTALVEITIPNSVTTIGWDAFANCDSLINITIPNSVTRIGDSAFAYCDVLETITFLGDAPTFGYNLYQNDAFDDVVATAYYPAGNETWTEEVRQDHGGTITWIAACLNHDYVSNVTDPSCTQNGCTISTCSICGDTKVSDEVLALGHSVVYAVDTAPTLEVEGALAGTCDRCGENLKIVLPKLSKQNYSLEVIVEPTKEAEGFGKYTWNVTDYGEFTFEAAISNVILGDVNDDGSVTILDLMRLANHFAKNAEINEANADVNNDGKVTILDLMRLANYFAGKATLG